MNFDTMIKIGKDLISRGIKYSMNGSRTGSDGTADCSGFVYKCLTSGGVNPMSWVPNTDSMHKWLLDNGYKLITHNGTWNSKKGDVTIFGLKGSSGGASGHVILWLNGNEFIHCTYKNAYNNGVYIETDDKAPYNMGHWYTYRYMGSVETPNPSGWVAERWHFKLDEPINLRTQPITSSEIITTLPIGSVVKYESYKIDNNGYVWLRQPRSNGYGYLASGLSKNGKRVSTWGSFK